MTYIEVAAFSESTLSRPRGAGSAEDVEADSSERSAEVEVRLNSGMTRRRRHDKAAAADMATRWRRLHEDRVFEFFGCTRECSARSKQVNVVCAWSCGPNSA